MFPCTPLVYSLSALCSFFIYILLFTDQKKKILVSLVMWSEALESTLQGFGFLIFVVKVERRVPWCASILVC